MENDLNNVVQYPIHKAVTALGAGGGAVGVHQMLDRISQFLPHDLAGWMAVLASFLASFYSFCILSEWWWKKFWKPLFKRWRKVRYGPTSF